MLPHEKTLVKRLAGRPFALLGINSDRDRDTYRKEAAALGVTWRSAWEGSTRGPIATRWNVHAWPTIYVLDGQGVIRYRDVRGGQLDEAVDALLSAMGSE